MGDPVLVRASLKTHTRDNDRDHDSCISVEARTADHQLMIAAAYLTECAGQYGYGNGETHEFDVPLVQGANAVTRSRCQRFEFRMGITPTGSDEWSFDAWLILHFDDGSTYWNDKLNQDINTTNPFNHKVAEFQCDWNFSQVQPPPQLKVGDKAEHKAKR